MSEVANTGASDFCQATGLPLGQATSGCLRDQCLPLGQRSGSLLYFLRFYWGLEDLLDNVYLQVALGQKPFEASILFFEFADACRFVCAHAAEASALMLAKRVRQR